MDANDTDLREIAKEKEAKKTQKVIRTVCWALSEPGWAREVSGRPKKTEARRSKKKPDEEEIRTPAYIVDQKTQVASMDRG